MWLPEEDEYCTGERDCAGVCGGYHELDCAGNCYDPRYEYPPATPDCKGTCNKVLMGCDGVCGSGKHHDCAGVCGGPSVPDCAGECYNPRKVMPPNVFDCAGECGGKAYVDCAGECNGPHVLDCEGKCVKVKDTKECYDKFHPKRVVAAPKFVAKTSRRMKFLPTGS